MAHFGREAANAACRCLLRIGGTASAVPGGPNPAVTVVHEQQKLQKARSPTHACGMQPFRSGSAAGLEAESLHTTSSRGGSARRGTPRVALPRYLLHRARAQGRCLGSLPFSSASIRRKAREWLKSVGTKPPPHRTSDPLLK